ncbi:metabotropic glutamate receptor 5-like isoform X2 [Gigantopelta aegis]|uniref:metabotropic glutamate receptor 5-like isoform X2 n=1 Tax=Gigantopelta aegis TaxID=1735272 RepID=UPI001B88AF83|nr:metabotropic glutamate receptor 5-like isoform X2 [Gigantopelta aegis]
MGNPESIVLCNYGVRGMEEFEDIAKRSNICIATTENIASSSDSEAFDKIVENLLTTPNATVIVCFCEGITVKKLFQAIQRKSAVGKFLVIGSDGWGNRKDVVHGVEKAAAGALSIKFYSPPLKQFNDYYSTLRHDNNSRNPWFTEFWQEKFNCSLEEDDQNKRCTGNESLANPEQDSKLGFVMNAVYTMAHALHNMHRDVCGKVHGLCDKITPINGTLYLQYLLNVSFDSYSGDSVHFDENGDPPGRYEILNYQPVHDPDGNVTYRYVTVGTWKTGTLEVNSSIIRWPNGQSDTPESICSKPCPKGFVKQVKGVVCCWVCTPCKENAIVINNSTCEACPLGYRPNDELDSCEQIPVESITWDSTEAIVAMTVACVGMFFTFWILIVFIRHNDTPVVKASTRELSYIILLGITTAYCCNFVMVAKPCIVTCYLSRILPGLSFSLMYGALVTRTNRIARILEGSKRIMTKKPRFMSASAQVVITGIIIGVECAVITAMLIIEPADWKFDYPTTKRVRLVCNTTTLGVIVPLGFDLFLIFMCTLYAVKTRNLPENFNEAKFIGFTMYTTCIIWLGFFPIYFGGESKVLTMSISISLSASVSLVLLFLPKIYIIIWAPEKNTRGAFTTSKEVRCHIGSRTMTSDSFEQTDGKYDGFLKSNNWRDRWKQKSLDEKRLRNTGSRFSLQHGASPFTHRHMFHQRPSTVAEQSGRGALSQSFRSIRQETEEEELCENLTSFPEETSSLMGDDTTFIPSRLTCDSECQTDDFLLNDICQGLRRRRIGLPSQRNVEEDHHQFDGANTNPSHAQLSNSVSSVSPRTSLASVSGAHNTLPLLHIECDQYINYNSDVFKNPNSNRRSSDLSELCFIDDMKAFENETRTNLPQMFSRKRGKLPQEVSPLRKHSCSILPTPTLSSPLESTTSGSNKYFSYTSLQPCGLSESRSASSINTMSSNQGSAKSAEELSVFSLSALEDEEKGVLDFQTYLKNRGLELDMSSVQTSDL